MQKRWVKTLKSKNKNWKTKSLPKNLNMECPGSKIPKTNLWLPMVGFCSILCAMGAQLAEEVMICPLLSTCVLTCIFWMFAWKLQWPWATIGFGKLGRGEKPLSVTVGTMTESEIQVDPPFSSSDSRLPSAGSDRCFHSGDVFIATHGRKYHRKDCRHIRVSMCKSFGPCGDCIPVA